MQYDEQTVIGEDSPDVGNNSGSPRQSSELRLLLVLAWPLILSNSFSTVQITIDRLFLSQLSADAVSGTTSPR